MTSLSTGNLARFWTLPVLGRFWGRLILLAFVSALCFIRAKIGLAGTQIFSHDPFMLLDGGWRILNGQRPHIDFNSHLGIFAYLPTAVGLSLAHNHVRGFGYGHALVTSVLTLWTYLVSANRLYDVPRVLLCLIMAFLTVDPSALGFSPLLVGPAMTYNRHAYGLLALLVIESLGDFKKDSRTLQFTGGMSTGVALSAAAFLKVSSFCAGLFLLIAMLPCRRQTKARWAGIITGFLLLTLLTCTYFGFEMAPMLRDMRQVAGARHLWPRIYLIDQIIGAEIYLAAFVVAARLWFLLKGHAVLARAITVAGVSVCLAGTLIIFGNFEQMGTPLAAFLAVLIVNALILRTPSDQQAGDKFQVALLLLGCTFVFNAFFSGSLSLTNAVYTTYRSAKRYPAMASSYLSGFIPVWDDAGYTAYVNDGLALVAKHRRPDDSVMSLDFTNPFSYGLGMKPAPGGTTVLQYSTTFDDTHKQRAERLFGSATLVMVPKTFSERTLSETIPRLYGSYLKQNFRQIAESENWKLYRTVH